MHTNIYQESKQKRAPREIKKETNSSRHLRLPSSTSLYHSLLLCDICSRSVLIVVEVFFYS